MSNKAPKNTSKNKSKSLRKCRPKSAKGCKAKQIDGDIVANRCRDTSLFERCDMLDKEDKDYARNRLEETVSAPAMLTAKERPCAEGHRSKRSHIKDKSSKSSSSLDTRRSIDHRFSEVQSFGAISETDLLNESWKKLLQRNREINAKMASSGIYTAERRLNGEKSKHCSSSSSTKRGSKSLSRIKSSRSSSEIHDLKCSSGTSSSSGKPICKSSSSIRTSKSLARMRTSKEQRSEEDSLQYIPERYRGYSYSAVPHVQSGNGIVNPESQHYQPSDSQQTKSKYTKTSSQPAVRSRSSCSNSKQKPGTNTAKQNSSKELDVNIKLGRSDKTRNKKDKNMTTIQKHDKGRQSSADTKKKTCAQRRKSLNTYLNEQRVIRKMEGQLDDGTASSLRRYALYRSMVNSSRLPDFLSNSKKDIPSTSYDTKEAKYYVTPWKPEYDEAEERMRKRYLSPMPEIVEPDIAPEKWDLMGTTLPKRVYIRETINGCVIDEVVDIKDERDWDILTYMSPLRHVDVKRKHHQKLRDLSFADVKDFEVYTYAYPWRVTS